MGGAGRAQRGCLRRRCRIVNLGQLHIGPLFAYLAIRLYLPAELTIGFASLCWRTAASWSGLTSRERVCCAWAEVTKY